jgi:type I restriction enzyme S subunit
MIATCNEIEFEKFILKKGQVAITKDSETPDDIGVSAYIAEEFENVVLGYHLALITPFTDKLDGQFLNYYFHTKHLQKYFENNAGGSGQRCTLPIDIIKEIPLFSPDLPTQTAIARVLSSLDDKIELNNKINKELENLAKTIYEYWFVQKAEENWERKSLKELGVEIIRGVTYNKDDIKTVTSKNVVGILRATNINGNVIDLDNLVYVDKSLISENQKLQLFDIMITMSSGSKEHIGKNGLFCFDNANVAFGAFCSKIEIDEKYKFYIYKYFQSEQFKNYVKNCCLGTNINNLNNDIIKNINVSIPPTELLEKFNKTVSSLFAAIIKNRQESSNLAQLRDFLLPLLMNGQVISTTLNDRKTS